MRSLPGCGNGNAILMFLNGDADELMVYYMSEPKRPFCSNTGEPIHGGVPSRESPSGPVCLWMSIADNDAMHTLRTSYE